MTEGDSPTVARRRIRLAIREARERAELTQAQVAEAMEWSLSKVIRIESGEVSIAPNDLRPLLSYLGFRDRTQVAGLLAAAKTARSRQRQAWYQAQGYHEFLTVALRQLIEFEADATVIRYYYPYIIPGPLQLPEYARAVTERWSEELPDGAVGYRVEARRHRRETLLSRLDVAQLYVMLDESVLMRPIGGSEVFAAQLRELLRLGGLANVHIRMVPFSVEAAMSNNAAFDLLSLHDDQDDDLVMYRETGVGDEIIEAGSTTSRHRARFEKLWAAATSEADTADFMRGRLQILGTTDRNSDEIH